VHDRDGIDQRAASGGFFVERYSGIALGLTPIVKCEPVSPIVEPGLKLPGVAKSEIQK
jgi:hypothetical protein